MKLINPDTKRMARELRLSGYLYPEIMAATGLAKGTLHFMLSKLELPPEIKAIIEAKQKAIRSASAARMARNNQLDRPAWLKSMEGIVRAPTIPAPKHVIEKRLENLLAANLQYLPHQLPIKAELEKTYKQKFKKEQVDGVIITYASRKTLILLAASPPMDINITKRFAVVSSRQDKRKRIAYISTVGKTAERRLRRLGCEVYPISLLRTTSQPQDSLTSAEQTQDD